MCERTATTGSNTHDRIVRVHIEQRIELYS